MHLRILNKNRVYLINLKFALKNITMNITQIDNIYKFDDLMVLLLIGCGCKSLYICYFSILFIRNSMSLMLSPSSKDFTLM